MGAATDRHIHPVFLILGAIILGGVFFVCAGTATFGILWFSNAPAKLASAPSAPALPKIEVDPGVKVKFGPWRRGRFYENINGEEVGHLHADVTAGAEPARCFEYVVDQYDANGRKINLSSSISFAELRAGETGEASVFVNATTARVVIRHRSGSVNKS